MNVAVVGSVSSSWHALRGLLRGGVQVAGVLGVDESQAAKIADYRSLRALATEAGVPFRAFVKVGEPDVADFLRTHRPDLLWVIGLSQLVPQSLIDLAPAGGVGFHPTMLPEGRGRAPVAWTILLNRRAAANLFYLAAEPDAGDIIIQREVPVLPDDYSEDLIARTNEVLEACVIELAPHIIRGELPRTPQDHSRATYYAKRTPADGLIDWTAPAEAIYRLVRAAGRPYPGAFTRLGGARLTLWRGLPSGHPQAPAATGGGGATQAAPGTILEVAPHAVLIATGQGAFWGTEFTLQPDGPWEAVLTLGVRLGGPK